MTQGKRKVTGTQPETPEQPAHAELDPAELADVDETAADYSAELVDEEGDES